MSSIHVIIVSQDTDRKRFDAASVGFPPAFVRRTAAAAFRDADKLVNYYRTAGKDVEVRYFVDGMLSNVEHVKAAR